MQTCKSTILQCYNVTTLQRYNVTMLRYNVTMRTMQSIFFLLLQYSINVVRSITEQD